MCRGPGARAARTWSVDVERMISPNRAEAGPENTAGTGRPWFSASTCARDTSQSRSTKCGCVSRGREATVGRDGRVKGGGWGVALRANTMRSQPLPISAYGSQDKGRWCRGTKGRGNGRERECTSADNSHKKTRRCLQKHGQGDDARRQQERSGRGMPLSSDARGFPPRCAAPRPWPPRSRLRRGTPRTSCPTQESSGGSSAGSSFSRFTIGAGAGESALGVAQPLVARGSDGVGCASVRPCLYAD